MSHKPGLPRPMAGGFCWRDNVGLSRAMSQFLEARYLLPILGGIRVTRRGALGSNGTRVVGVLRTRAVKGPFSF